MNEPIIQLMGVCKSFNDSPVLSGVDLSIYRGEITTIIGKSGVGKSVLLKHLVGLLEPDAGTILFEGRPLSEMKRRERRALKNRISYVFQGTALFDSMTVFENIALPLTERTSLETEAVRERVRRRMQELDLGDIGGDYPSQLSGGMKKRVALARALVTDPELVLFDEPTTGLDPIRKNAVHSMIADYQKKFEFTGVMVSHDIPDIFYISQRIAMLEGGRILVEGPPDVIQNSSDPAVQEFVRGFERHRDSMTGLVPTMQAVSRYTEAMACLARYQIGFTLVVFSIENLEQINRNFGHVAGQTLIRNFAVRLRQRVRLTDVCSRYGMDKLLLILPGTGIGGAKRLCANLASVLKPADLLNGLYQPDFCFSIRAGFAEAEAGDMVEKSVSDLDLAPDSFYDFKIC